MDKDFYDILGLDRSASKRDIIRAYRKLAARYHPDKHQGNPLADLAEEKFKDINEAYQALTGGAPIEAGSRKPAPKKEAEDISADAKEFMYRGITSFNEGRYKNAIDNFDRI